MEKVKFMITKKTCVRPGRLCVRHAAGGDRGYGEERERGGVGLPALLPLPSPRQQSGTRWGGGLLLLLLLHQDGLYTHSVFQSGEKFF